MAPVLEALAGRFGETAHYAVLDGDEVVYRAKVDPPSGAVRLTSVIGGRNPARATGVGKALLAARFSTRAEALEWGRAHPVEQRTPNTLTDDEDFAVELMATRERGYAIDDQENEMGINCIAVRLTTAFGDGAVSVSALAYRTPLEVLISAVGDIRMMMDGSMSRGVPTGSRDSGTS
ncbi:IclR family transcriptional regulator [Tessaracoccus palaemonis]|uniref:IclR family transcriptional regulator n=1 Tax=Tessaracoccus palaemonis TaxID=2829499 RepID=UPI002107D91A|nr:IclR family transcriptional regulator C-terminal domain-containing protein [Tessaracoccus palaemonis]